MRKQILILVALLFIIFVGLPALFLLIIGDKPREASIAGYLGPRQVTSESDSEYQKALQNARLYEERGAMTDAAKAYSKAAEINRFYLPSYYPLLDAARCNIVIGKKDVGTRQLDSFISSAKEELKIEPTRKFIIDQTTPDHERSVKKLLREAEELRRKISG